MAGEFWPIARVRAKGNHSLPAPLNACPVKREAGFSGVKLFNWGGSEDSSDPEHSRRGAGERILTANS